MPELEPYYGQFDSTAIDDILSRANTGLDANGVALKAISDKNGNDIAETYATINSLATVATTGNYSDLNGKPTLAAVATSGSYSDLNDTPNLATVATTGSYGDLQDTPSLATVATSGSFTDLTDKPVIDDALSSSSTNAVQNKVVYAALVLKAPTSDLSAESSARASADAKLSAALAEKIDSGDKNKLTVNSDTTPSSGSGYFVQNLPLVLPAGDYHVTFKRDTAGQATFVIKDGDGGELARWSRASGITSVSEDVTLAAQSASISIYVGNSVTVTNAMVCSKADWQISNAFVPYRPSWQELWDMVQSIQQSLQ